MSLSRAQQRRAALALPPHLRPKQVGPSIPTFFDAWQDLEDVFPRDVSWAEYRGSVASMPSFVRRCATPRADSYGRTRRLRFPVASPKVSSSDEIVEAFTNAATVWNDNFPGERLELSDADGVFSPALGPASPDPPPSRCTLCGNGFVVPGNMVCGPCHLYHARQEELRQRRERNSRHEELPQRSPCPKCGEAYDNPCCQWCRTQKK